MAARVCVFCRQQPQQPPWEPFCSERCRLQDLARWVDDKYRIPGESVPQHDGESGLNHDDEE